MSDLLKQFQNKRPWESNGNSSIVKYPLPSIMLTSTDINSLQLNLIDLQQKGAIKPRIIHFKYHQNKVQILGETIVLSTKISLTAPFHYIVVFFKHVWNLLLYLLKWIYGTELECICKTDTCRTESSRLCCSLAHFVLSFDYFPFNYDFYPICYSVLFPYLKQQWHS